MKQICKTEEYRTFSGYKENQSPIKLIHLDPTERCSLSGASNSLIVVMKGIITYSYAKEIDKLVVEKNIFLLPAGYESEIYSLENSIIIHYQIDTLRKLCDYSRLEYLLHIDPRSDESSNSDVLPFNDMLQSYMHILITYLNDGIKSHYFYELKIEELFYIFRTYYSEQNMKNLFEPILTTNLAFSESVITASKTARSLQDLADLTGYSISGFNKRFKKVFNKAPYQWLQEKRSERLYREIRLGELSLKELSINEGFSSFSEFNKFCNKHYGISPSKIRKKEEMA